MYTCVQPYRILIKNPYTTLWHSLLVLALVQMRVLSLISALSCPVCRTGNDWTIPYISSQVKHHIWSIFFRYQICRPWYMKINTLKYCWITNHFTTSERALPQIEVCEIVCFCIAVINFGTNIVRKYYQFHRVFFRPICKRICPFLWCFKKPFQWLETF